MEKLKEYILTCDCCNKNFPKYACPRCGGNTCRKCLVGYYLSCAFCQKEPRQNCLVCEAHANNDPFDDYECFDCEKKFEEWNNE